jgi:hypothetical protein
VDTARQTPEESLAHVMAELERRGLVATAKPKRSRAKQFQRV